MEILKKLENIEGLIRAGGQQNARDELSAIKPGQVSPVDLVYYCSLLRRTGLSIEVIKILQPLVYPKARSAQTATSEEKLEYASNLVRLGVLNEAERILVTIDPAKQPIVLIRLGFLFISRWDYETANTYFRKYILHPQADPYNTRIAQVNELQGLVNLRLTDEAWNLAQRLLKELDPVQNKLLLAAVYEFCAEIHRLKKDLTRAYEFIQQGKTLLRNSNSIDEFLMRKQEGILTSNLKVLSKLRIEAVQRKHHESVRDLDFHIALAKKDSRLLNRVYWQTQSPSYKRRLLEYASEHHISIDTTFYQFNKNKGVVIELSSSKKDKAVSRLLKALLVEGYKPIKIIDLFANVFPDEIFFPKSSADKMHQLIKRLRAFLIEVKYPLKLVCENDRYTLRVEGNFSLSVTGNDRANWEVDLSKEIKTRYFDVQQAKSLWGCSLRTTMRRLQILKSKSAIQTHGSTRSTRYKFIS